MPEGSADKYCGRLKPHDLKMTDQVAWHEIAGPEMQDQQRFNSNMEGYR